MALRFTIPSNLTAEKEQFESAKLSMYTSFDLSPKVNGPKSLYRMTSAWSEKFASWKDRFEGIPWKTAGGDYVSTPILKAPSAEYNVWETFDVTETVRFFLDHPDSNFGFMVKFDSLNENNFSIYVMKEENEEAMKQFRPKLTLKFSGTTDLSSTNNVIHRNAPRITRGTVRMPNGEGFSIAVHDIRGRSVFEGDFKGADLQLSSLVPPGIYMATIRGHRGTVSTIRFAIE